MSLQARRNGSGQAILLARPQNHSTHPGLWLDRYLERQEIRGEGGESGTKANFFKQVVAIGEPANYPDFFVAHTTTLREMADSDCEVKQFNVKVIGRVTTGLGAANVLENGLALHRTYGVPYLPGSGLKGLTARVARERLGARESRWKNDKDGDFYRAVFGSTDEAGGIHFFDALPVPEAQNGGWRLVADVLTPHHGEYYKGTPNAAPADWDSPIPIPFLSVEGTFQITLAGSRDWPDLAWKILRQGLVSEGFGAKTSSGYGRMTLIEQKNKS